MGISDDWMEDAREIRAVRLAEGRFDHLVGDRFERIQRPGEYCYIPWIRVRTFRGGCETIIEAPLNHADAIEFAPASVDRSGEADETAPLSAGSAEGESAVPSESEGDAQP